MSEFRVLKEVFELKRDAVREKWRKLHNEELYDLYCSPNIIRVIKSRRNGWAGCVARMGDRRGTQIILVGISEERDHFEDPGVDRMILNWIFKKKDGVSVDRLNLAQDRDKRRALVNAVMNLRVQ